MKLSLKRNVCANGRIYGIGEELILCESNALRLIAKGYAIEIPSEEIPDTKEETSITPIKTPARRRARKKVAVNADI